MFTSSFVSTFFSVRFLCSFYEVNRGSVLVYNEVDRLMLGYECMYSTVIIGEANTSWRRLSLGLSKQTALGECI